MIQVWNLHVFWINIMKKSSKYSVSYFFYSSLLMVFAIEVVVESNHACLSIRCMPAWLPNSQPMITSLQINTQLTIFDKICSRWVMHWNINCSFFQEKSICIYNRNIDSHFGNFMSALNCRKPDKILTA